MLAAAASRPRKARSHLLDCRAALHPQGVHEIRAIHVEISTGERNPGRELVPAARSQFFESVDVCRLATADVVGGAKIKEILDPGPSKLVNAVSNSRVPKITVLTGGSYGAGNYALCGKAFDPRFIYAWPTARNAVMGAAQATGTLLDVMIASLNFHPILK